MKKILILLSSVFALCLTSCNLSNTSDNQSTNHVHTHTAGTPVEENKVNPTCTQDGSYDLVTYCVDDHEEMSREHKTIPALGHDYNKNVTAPTYDADGLITYTCSRCGDTYTEKGESKLEHHYSLSWSYNESSHWHACTDSGYEHLKADEAEHIFDHDVTNPTYESGGYTTHTCTICGYSYIDGNTDKLNHNYSTTWTYSETTHWHACTDSGYEHLKADEAEHIFDHNVTNPTYESDGYTTHTCTICGYSYIDSETDKIPITITWKNYDGSILEIDENVPYGSAPSYDGETPTKPNQDVYSFTFKGWSPEVKKATEPAIYTAQYEQEKVAARLTITYALMNTKTDKAIQTYTTLPAEVGEISTSQIYDFNTNVDLTAKMNEGFIFLGWYYQNTLISNYTKYSYVIWDEDASIEARFCYKTYSLNIYSNSRENGLVLLKYSYTRTYKEVYYGDTSVTVSIISETVENKEVRANYQSSYDYKSQVSIAAFSQTGVRFLGWYDENNNLVSTKAVYTFNMPNKDYVLEAKWDHFNVNYYLNGGVNNENNPSTYSTEDGMIELQNPTKTGYDFVGWRLNGEPVTFIDTSLIKDISLEAIWEATIYSINYQLNGGINNEENPLAYNIEESTIALANPSRVGYNFAGWYSDPEFNYRVFEIEHGSYGNVNLYAKWEAMVYSITYELNGGINDPLNPSNYTVEDEITFAEPSYGYRTKYMTFTGWYHGDEILQGIKKGTTGNIVVVANWIQTESQIEEEARDADNGIVPIIDNNKKIVTYGLYPQTNVNDESLINELNQNNSLESNGWYLYGGNYYAKLIATPNSSNYKFDNGNKIVSGNTYWFKCEPIKWKILSGGSTYYLLSSKLLDAHCYNNSTDSRTINGETIGASNYRYSDIRSWLNNDFYNMAFSLHNNHIETYKVDNSFYDNVFLPSEADYKNAKYGFASSNPANNLDNHSIYRRCQTTDWARARGSFSCTNTDYPYNKNGCYWTRTKYNDSNVWYVDYTGYLNNSSNTYLGPFDNSVNNGKVCVRPAIYFKIS